MADAAKRSSHPGNFRDLSAFLWRMASIFPIHAVGLISLTLLISVLEGVGISFLVPMVEAIGFGTRSPVSEKIQRYFESAGLQFELKTALVFFFMVNLVRIAAVYSQQVEIGKLQMRIST